MMEAGEFIADLDDPSDEELATFDEEVLRVEAKRRKTPTADTEQGEEEKEEEKE